MKHLYQVNHDTQRVTKLGPATRANMVAMEARVTENHDTIHEIEPRHRWEVHDGWYRKYSYELLVCEEDLPTETFEEREGAYRVLWAAGHFAGGSNDPWFREPIEEGDTDEQESTTAR